jgi:ectoine hydroxylase-related dioxygenase (phytanoyl-CoA dioxygenase family)
MYMAKKPLGGTGVALHQDTHYIRNEPNTLMACGIACNDTGADNGGLCVVPGSHKQGLFTAGEVRESDQARQLGQRLSYARSRGQKVDGADVFL